MTTTRPGTPPAHFPADPHCFQFDASVAEIFEDMASRSIPNFHTAHLAHVSMAQHLLDLPESRVLDLGASRGTFLRYAMAAGGKASYTAIDNSPAMCEHLRRDFPTVNVLHMSATDIAFDDFVLFHKFDVICCNYVLQFLPRGDQVRVLTSLVKMLTPGGMLFLGHKEAVPEESPLGILANREYIKFRLRNGYSMAEIDAKTKALKGSMFPMKHSLVRSILDASCSDVFETTRFMMFSTLAARK